MSRVMLAFPLLLAACASSEVETIEISPQQALLKNSGFTAHLEISRYPAGTNAWKDVWKTYSQASGFLYKNHVVTVGHIAKEGWTFGSVVATFFQEPHTSYHLELVAVNREYDLALLRFATDSPPFTGAEFEDAETANGDKIYSIGSPAGIPFSISEGKIIKAIHRDAYLLHDCFSVGGSSGAVVLNADGKVIAMTTSKYRLNAPEFPGAIKAVRSIEIERWVNQFLD